MSTVDEVMQGQLNRFKKDLVRWGIPAHDIEWRMAEQREILIRLRNRPKTPHVSTPITGPSHDSTFGKFPWLPLCDL